MTAINKDKYISENRQARRCLRLTKRRNVYDSAYIYNVSIEPSEFIKMDYFFSKVLRRHFKKKEIKKRKRTGLTLAEELSKRGI